MTSSPSPRPPRKVSLVCVVRTTLNGREILLGTKRHGFGQGRIVVPGGKIDVGESPSEAAARELFEETDLQVAPDILLPVGIATFRFPHRDDDIMRAHLYRANFLTGTARDSSELEIGWYSECALPFAKMWADAPYWLESAIAGETVYPTFTYAADNVTLESVEV